MPSQALSYIFFFSFHLYVIYAHLHESNEMNSPTLKFLNQLNGIQKGYHHKGVNELKKHLSYLGYMNCPTNSPNPKDDNTFDNCLELALKKYQHFYGLRTIGIFDGDTIEKMLKPRRGMPDFRDHDKRTAPFHEHFSFVEGRPKWRKRRLRYAFKLSTRPETMPPIERVMRLWASVTPFQFIRVNSVTAAGADIRISFIRGIRGERSPFPDSEVAHAFPPPDGRIHFNKDLNWDARVHFYADLNLSTNGEGEFFDLQTVALHELGHALGLGHSRNEAAVMYATIEPGVRKGLHKDDIDGIRALYR